ncbi:MAG: recombinase family protein [Chloroflexota bacterium]
MTRFVAGYVRESSGDTLNDAEREGQRIDIRRLAARDGHNPETIVWFDDWGYSGTRRDRPAYVRLRADIGEGRVEVVYARSVDRLGRDEAEGIDFENFARIKGTRVVTDRDGERTANPDDTNVLVRYIPHLIAAEESRLGRVRARAARATRVRNIEAHVSECPWQGPGTATEMCATPQRHFDGVAPYGVLAGEDIEAVFAAFADTGSYQGAARRLNAMGVPPRRGLQWESTTVMRVIARGSASGRIVLPSRRARRHRTVATHIFARLLVCPHDGSILTATFRSVRGGRDVTYFCRQGRQAAARCRDHGELVIRRADWRWDCPAGHLLGRFDVVGDHPRPWSVPEHIVLAWAKAATANVMGHTPHLVHEGIVRVADTDEAAVARLKEQRRRVVGAHIRLDIGDEERDALLAALDADIEALQGAQRATATWALGIDWGMATGALNARLREVLHSVRLGPDMRPIAGVWLRQPHHRPEGRHKWRVHPEPGRNTGGRGWLVPYVTEHRRRYGRPSWSRIPTWQLDPPDLPTPDGIGGEH